MCVFVHEKERHKLKVPVMVPPFPPVYGGTVCSGPLTPEYEREGLDSFHPSPSGTSAGRSDVIVQSLRLRITCTLFFLHIDKGKCCSHSNRCTITLSAAQSLNVNLVF